MTIEMLEALEKAATQAPWSYYSHGTGMLGANLDGMAFFPVAACIGHENGEAAAAARNALPNLLAVAKAAKAYVNARDSYDCVATRCQLKEALSRLEAQ